MWIVMTSCAKMPSSCWGIYRNVALVKVCQHFAAWNIKPAMLSKRARGVLELRHMGAFHVGKTERCAYQRALASARERAQLLNNANPVDQSFMTFGGSA